MSLYTLLLVQKRLLLIEDPLGRADESLPVSTLSVQLQELRHHEPREPYDDESHPHKHRPGGKEVLHYEVHYHCRGDGQDGPNSVRGCVECEDSDECVEREGKEMCVGVECKVSVCSVGYGGTHEVNSGEDSAMQTSRQPKNIISRQALSVSSPSNSRVGGRANVSKPLKCRTMNGGQRKNRVNTPV